VLDAPYLHRHVDALRRLSHASSEQRIAAEIDALAEEMRMLLAVAELNDLATTLNHETPALVPADGPEHAQRGCS